MAGRCPVRHPADGHGGDLGLRSCRSDGDPQRRPLGAKQVIAIDHLPERLEMAEAGGAITINFDEESVVERLNELTGGEGPEKCIDAIGMEAHVSPSMPDTVYDRAKQMLGAESDRPRPSRDDLRLPPGRGDFDPRCLWRVGRQDPDGSS